MSSASISFFFFVSLLLFVVVQWSNQQERTRKATRTSLEQIRKLIDARAQREFAQNDSPQGMPPAEDEPNLGRRQPGVKRHHDELAVNDPDGEYLQGDVQLAEWQAQRLQFRLAREEEREGEAAAAGMETANSWRRRRRKKRKIGRFLEPFYKRWDKRRPISFDMAENVPEKTRQRIRQALRVWESQTCLSFAEGGPDTDRLEFFDGGGCSSFVGRAGGTQGISIATPGCDFVGIIAHEVGHALGTFHEQARPDQQRHIAVHYANIPSIRWNNFQPLADDQAATLGLPYDAGSVLHYGPYGFASDQFRPTISTLDRQWQSTIGQREGPSFLDIQAINQAYRCAEHCLLGAEPLACQHGGYPHPRDCTRCLCPAGFSGALCQRVQQSTCGGTIQLSLRNASYIATPNFPGGPFPPDLSCFWLLRAPPQGHVLLQFEQQPFGYPCEDTCDKAFVELKTGADFRVTGYRFCCPSPPTLTFRSAGAEMVVIHSASGAEMASFASSRGFKARVWSDREWPPAAVIEPAATTPKTKTMAPLIGEEETTETTKTDQHHLLLMTLVTSPNGPTGARGFSPPSVFSSTIPPPPLPLPPLPPPSVIGGGSPSADCAACGDWSAWSECSQMCGGCGRRARRRACPYSAAPPAPPQCQTEEKRLCNQPACPAGTNFLFNNAEFHLLWRGCCIGLFARNSTGPDGSPLSECGPLESSENPFLRIISSLLTSQDAKANSTAKRRTGEHR